MMDMLKSQGLVIDVQMMEHLLGIPIVPISASKGQGIKELIERAHHDGVERSGDTLSEFDEQRLAERRTSGMTAIPISLISSTTGGSITPGNI